MFIRSVCWHPLSSTFILMLPYAWSCRSTVNRGRGTRVAYLHDADLVRNRRVLNLEILVTDLEFADNMALEEGALCSEPLHGTRPARLID